MFSGKKLKNIRENTGWSQKKLSMQSDVSYGYIAELENGKKTNPSFEIVEKLADTLKINIKDLQEKMKK